MCINVNNPLADSDKGRLCSLMAQIAADCLGRLDDAIDLWNGVLEAMGEAVAALTASRFSI